MSETKTSLMCLSADIQTKKKLDELEDRSIEIIQSETQRKEWEGKTEHSSEELLDNVKQSNTLVIEVVKAEGKKRKEEIFEEIKTKNFSRCVKDNQPQIPEVYRTSNTIKTKTDQKYLGISQSKCPKQREIVKTEKYYIL